MRRHWMPVAVMTYLVLAISWWSVLLFRKNEAFFFAEASSIRCQITDREELREALARLETKHARQNGMILGESLFLTLSVLAGIYLITRAYRKEYQISRQQQNFLLSVTHELRSPIAAIRLSLETLLRPGIEEDKREKLIRGALSEDERLDDLIDKLLLATRMEGDPGLHPTRIALDRWLERFVSGARSKWPDWTIELEGGAAGAFIEADEHALQSIFTNLIENAVKYGGQDRYIGIQSALQPGAVEVRVLDTGPGIAPDEKKQIFKKFYRIGSENTRRSKGTGLGLYISQRLVSAHNGQIWVSDRPGGGSIFHIRLPQATTNDKT